MKFSYLLQSPAVICIELLGVFNFVLTSYFLLLFLCTDFVVK